MYLSIIIFLFCDNSLLKLPLHTRDREMRYFRSLTLIYAYFTKKYCFLIFNDLLSVFAYTCFIAKSTVRGIYLSYAGLTQKKILHFFYSFNSCIERVKYFQQLVNKHICKWNWHFLQDLLCCVLENKFWSKHITDLALSFRFNTSINLNVYISYWILIFILACSVMSFTESWVTSKFSKCMALWIGGRSAILLKQYSPTKLHIVDI